MRSITIKLLHSFRLQVILEEIHKWNIFRLDLPGTHHHHRTNDTNVRLRRPIGLPAHQWMQLLNHAAEPSPNACWHIAVKRYILLVSPAIQLLRRLFDDPFRLISMFDFHLSSSHCNFNVCSVPAMLTKVAEKQLAVPTDQNDVLAQAQKYSVNPMPFAKLQQSLNIASKSSRSSAAKSSKHRGHPRRKFLSNAVCPFMTSISLSRVSERIRICIHFHEPTL